MSDAHAAPRDGRDDRDAVGGRPHALAIGASGMLADAVRGLAWRGWEVTLVARRLDRLERVAAGAPSGTVRPRTIDYRDTTGLRRLVADAAAERGPIRLVLAWIHDTAPEAHDSIAEQVGATPPRCHYVEVLGSATVDPSTLGRERARRLGAQPFLEHRRVLLGYGDGGRRWLTNQEISTGVLDAVDTDVQDHVIGTLEPFRGAERRPQR